MSLSPKSKKILLALATAILAALTAWLSGCSVATHLQLRSFAAYPDKEPPPLPPWASDMNLPAGYELVNDNPTDSETEPDTGTDSD